MKTTYNTDQAIENLVTVHCGDYGTARDRHLYRETLRSLARLAVGEHALNLKKDLDKTTGMTKACEHA
jgi:hypothetical protein